MKQGTAAFALAALLFAGPLPGAALSAGAAEVPLRVVTLAPSLGELAADLEGENLSRIVGVSEYTDYPPALQSVASVGPYTQVNIEKVIALKPDLVLATTDGNSKDQILHLQELKVPVLVVDTTTLDQVGRSMIEVARALGVAARGEQMAAQFNLGLERVRARGRARTPKKSVLLELGDAPLIVVGGKSFLSEALAAVGARNLYADSSQHYPRPSYEDVIRRDPDTIIVLALGHDLGSFNRLAGRWAQYPVLRAVKARAVRVVQGDPILRPSLRFLEGLSLLEKAIYGKPETPKAKAPDGKP